jgi:hypothetical protein
LRRDLPGPPFGLYRVSPINQNRPRQFVKREPDLRKLDELQRRMREVPDLGEEPFEGRG